MNAINDITDDDFVPFLHELGVETFKKSFEWMLNDPNFAGVLRWIYNNLDNNNALSAREEYRYIELQKKGTLLSPDDLEASITAIQEQYPGICLPGDQKTKEDVKLDIAFHKESLCMLEKQEDVFKNLIRQNEINKDELTLEIVQLNSAHQQCNEDEATAANECMELAREVETITDGVINVIAENLDLYYGCKGDKDIAKRFFTFSPLESYRQSQALFRSLFDLYVSKNLAKRQNETCDEDLRSTMAEAKSLEERLTEAAFAYAESKAELSGEQAKLALISNYNNVHPSQITSCLIEAQSALELLEQEENIAEQQVANAVEELAQSRTSLAASTVTAAALKVRHQIQSSLTHLVDVWQRAYALDRLLYYCMRHELRTLEEFVQFASQLRQYVVSEAAAVVSRMESMNEVHQEHLSSTIKHQSSNPLLQALCAILSVQTTDDATVLVKVFNELQGDVKQLKDNVMEGLRKKETALVEIKSSRKLLEDYIWSGCTKQPNSRDRTVASLTHSLRQQIEAVDKRVVEASGRFTSLKNGDKKNLRKLWQWFLTDPSRLHAAMKNTKAF